VDNPEKSPPSLCIAEGVILNFTAIPPKQQRGRKGNPEPHSKND